MKLVALAASGLLTAATAQSAPPDQYDSLAPLKVELTLADAEWVDRECRKRVGPERSPPVIEACAGVGRKWIIMRHGSLYPDERCGYIVKHETRHVRGWSHG